MFRRKVKRVTIKGGSNFLEAKKRGSIAIAELLKLSPVKNRIIEVKDLWKKMANAYNRVCYKRDLKLLKINMKTIN